jgi:hypothetical protein
LPDPSSPEKVISMAPQLYGAGVAAALFGGLDGEPLLNAYTVPSATPPAAINPILSKKDRTWRCFAGAMAVPAGREAAPPAVVAVPAAAVPSGCVAPGVCGAVPDCDCVADCSGFPSGPNTTVVGAAVELGALGSGASCFGVVVGCGCSGPGETCCGTVLWLSSGFWVDAGDCAWANPLRTMASTNRVLVARVGNRFPRMFVTSRDFNFVARRLHL